MSSNNTIDTLADRETRLEEIAKAAKPLLPPLGPGGMKSRNAPTTTNCKLFPSLRGLINI